MNLDVPHDVILDRVAGRLVVRFFIFLVSFFTHSPHCRHQQIGTGLTPQ